MSPTRMLHNCGNSSRLLLRKKLPMGVKYASGLLSKCVATAGVVLRPTRSDQYRAGAFEVRRTAKATTTRQAQRTRPRSDQTVFSCNAPPHRPPQPLIHRHRRHPAQQLPGFGNIHLQIAAQALHDAHEGGNFERAHASTEAACTSLLTLSAKNLSLHSDRLICSAAGRKGATSCAARGQLMVLIFEVMASPSHSALTTVFWSFHGPAPWFSAWARCGKLGRIFCLQYQAKSNQSRPFR